MNQALLRARDAPRRALHNARRSFSRLLASQERRAFAFTPPIALFLFVVFFLTGNPFDDFGYYMQRLGWQLMIMLVLSPMWLISAYFIIGLIYLPFHDLFRRLNHRSLPAVAVAACAVSMAVYAFPDLLASLDDGMTTYSFRYEDCQVIQNGQRTPCGWRSFWKSITLWGIYGAVVGAVFWFIYAGGLRLWLRPDEPWT